MSDPTEIEKKSLEAHVELCAQRYKFLEDQLVTVEEQLSKNSTMIGDLHELVQKIVNKRNDQIIAWGLGIIGAMMAIIGWLISRLLGI
mgnify:CR=1 FL=1|jgi:hypothetical protein